MVTEYGGDIEAIPVSARTHEGIDTLLETILLVAEAEVDPKANPRPPGRRRGDRGQDGQDPRRGRDVLVQHGTLHVGDLVVAGTIQGRLKARSTIAADGSKTRRRHTPSKSWG